MFKKLLPLISVLMMLHLHTAYGQNDSTQKFQLNFYTSAFSYLAGEEAIYSEVKIKNHGYGGSIGMSHPGPILKQGLSRFESYEFPGSIYYGLNYSLFWKIYSKTQPNKNFNISLIHKYVGTGDIIFYEPFGRYASGENSYIFGLDITREIILSKNPNLHFALFYGIGSRLKFRNLTVFWIDSDNPASEIPISRGRTKDKQFYPTLRFGIHFGYSYRKKE